MGVITILRDDGTLDVRTDDRDPYLAEVRAKDLAGLERALAHFRARGEPRPVLFQVLGGYLNTAPEDAVLVPCIEDPAISLYVMPRSATRGILEQMVGKQARRWFRNPRWPSSYWTVIVHRDRVIDLCESRTPAEADRAAA